MIPGIEYWRGRPATYGWPLDDPAKGTPMNITGLAFRIRVLLPGGEVILPAYGAVGRPLVDGKEIEHPAMLMVDIGPVAIVAGPGRYALILETNDTSGWQVLPVCDQSIIVR